MKRLREGGRKGVKRLRGEEGSEEIEGGRKGVKRLREGGRE